MLVFRKILRTYLVDGPLMTHESLKIFRPFQENLSYATAAILSSEIQSM